VKKKQNTINEAGELKKGKSSELEGKKRASHFSDTKKRENQFQVKSKENFVKIHL